MKRAVFTVTEAAHELGVSTARVRRLILDGRLPVIEVTPRLRIIRRVDLERFMENRLPPHRPRRETRPKRRGRPPGRPQRKAAS